MLTYVSFICLCCVLVSSKAFNKCDDAEKKQTGYVNLSGVGGRRGAEVKESMRKNREKEMKRMRKGRKRRTKRNQLSKKRENYSRRAAITEFFFIY